MRLLGLCAVGASWLVACGATELGRGGTSGRGTHRTLPDPPNTQIVGDATVPTGPSPTGSASAPPEPLGPAFCTGAGWSDPAKPVLLGSTEDSIVLVRADGTRKIVAPLKNTTGILNSVRAGDYLGIQEFVAPRSVHVLRLSSSGELLLDLELQDVEGIYGSLGMEPDGTMVLRGAGGVELRILPDGTVERREGPPSSSSPPTPEGYFVLGAADVAGWQVVALPSSVIPLANAFYEASSATLQRVRYRSDWVPNAMSKGRIVYLGTTPQGIALIDEGVADARTTPLPGTMKWSQVYGYEERVVVRRNDVPIAWLDVESRAVTVLSEVIALIDGGAARVGTRVQFLVKDGVPLRIVDVDAYRDVDLSALNLTRASEFDVHEETDTALATADGVPILWFDRRTREVRALDRSAVLGTAPPGATSETLFAGTGALAVSDGLPRSWTDLGTGTISTPTLAVSAGAVAKTHSVGDRAVVTIDGSPRFIVNVGTGAVSDVAAIAGPLSYDSVTVTAPWLVALSGLAPIFRVNTDSGEAVPFAVVPLPLPYSFYDAKFADDPANHPPTQYSFSGGRLHLPAVTTDGYVHAALRDDAIAGVYRLGPTDQAWQSIGQPFRDVVWTSVAEHEHAFVVETGYRYDCYCNWSRVSWSSADAGASNLLADAVQLVPRGSAAPVIVEGAAALNFHSSDACVLVVPQSSGTPQAKSDPFAYDLLRGTKTPFDGMRSIRWIDGE